MATKVWKLEFHPSFSKSYQLATNIPKPSCIASQDCMDKFILNEKKINEKTSSMKVAKEMRPCVKEDSRSPKTLLQITKYQTVTNLC
jgi:hypothetical protein